MLKIVTYLDAAVTGISDHLYPSGVNQDLEANWAVVQSLVQVPISIRTKYEIIKKVTLWSGSVESQHAQYSCQ